MRGLALSALLVSAGLLAGCPDEEPSGGDATSDVTADVTDGSDGGDVSDAGDAGDALDGEGDVEVDVGPSCTPPPDIEPDPIDQSQTKFALSLFHYNIQYVIGGLEYFDEDGEPVWFANQEIAAGWDNDRVEDWIVTETFAPMVEMYAKHPEWRVTFEMQAYMVEVIAERHPEVLELLRERAQAGQIELVSFHYADQLFLAYPREDLQRSIDRTRAVFEEHCLPLSGVVFNQEGQAGEGRQQMLVDNGYTIGVFPKNLFRYVRDGEQWWPYYESRGGTLVVGPGGVDPASGIEVAWDFFDDGELRSTPEKVPPYVAPLFEKSEEAVADFEAQLTAREAAGFKMTHITDFVRQLEGQGVEKKPAPPLVDGTWQPPSTDSIHRWLGGRSDVSTGDDEDNKVRSGNAVARMHVAALQVLIDVATAAGADVAAEAEEMRTVWENLWHAEVSDSSGVNPWRGEVLFGLNMNAWLLENTERIRNQVLAELGWARALIDLQARTAVEEQPPGVEPPTPIDAPMALGLRADGRAIDERWFELSPGHQRVVLTFSTADTETVDCPGAPADEGCDFRWIHVGFPRTMDTIAYSPGLIEDEVVSYDFDQFSFQNGEVYLPLANGLIGIGPDTWVIKHVRDVHIAARIGPVHTDVAFIDETIWEEDAVTWTFDVFTGTAEEALARANRLNIAPQVYYEAP